LTRLQDKRSAVDYHYEVAHAMLESDLEGCAIVDSGASAGMTSDFVITAMQESYIAKGENMFKTTVQNSNMVFTIANGKKEKVKHKVDIQPIDDSPFAGRSYTVNVNANDVEHNRAPMLIGSDYLARNRCIVDFETGAMVYKDEPTTIHHLKKAPNGHTLLMPITRDQCEQHYRRSRTADSHNTVLQAMVTPRADH